jgi:UDP-2,3-diacylglucosamine pyrophosphatase LpxH
MSSEPELKIPEDRSVIVVSDLHLGGDEDPDTARRFCRFLEHLRKGQCEVSDDCHGNREGWSGGTPGKKTLLPPEKIILLGDIMELWDSRKRDRNRAFLDLMLPLLKLRDMDCDVVYVTGNHDEDVAELLESTDRDKKELKDFRIEKRERWEASHPGKKRSKECSSACLEVFRSEEELIPFLDRIVGLYRKDASERSDEKKKKKYDIRKRPEVLKIEWRGKHKFEICSRHYPAHRLKDPDNVMKDGKSGLHVGDTEYAFVHGQQFDKQQITHSISQGIGGRFDPVDFFQDLASISVTQEIPVETHVLVVLLAGILLKIAFSPDWNPFIPVIGAATAIVCAAAFLYGLLLFGVVKRGPDRVASAPLLTGICGAGFIGFLLLIIAGLMNLPEGAPAAGIAVWGIFGWLFVIPLIALLYILAVMTIPSLIAWSKRKVYNSLFNIRSKDSDFVIRKTFDPDTYKYTTKVLVYGHTHVADFEKPENTDKIRLLVNTGSWVNDKKNPVYDTFAYIDKDGVCCLIWNDDEEKIECFRKTYGGRCVSVCDYIVKNEVRLTD